MTQQNTDPAITHGAHHIGLTVPNLQQTREFFLNTLGYDQVGEVPVRHMMCNIPGGIRVEFLAANA